MSKQKGEQINALFFDIIVGVSHTGCLYYTTISFKTYNTIQKGYHKNSYSMKIELTLKKTQVEVPDYGTFEVSPFGAGAEAEIRIAMRELDDAMKTNENFSDLIKREENGEEIDRESAEYKEALEHFKNTSKKVEEVKDLTLTKLRGVIKGKNVDKLFNDFTYEQLMELYGRAK